MCFDPATVGFRRDMDVLDIGGLEELVLRLLEENAARRSKVSAPGDENRRLDGLKRADGSPSVPHQKFT